MPWGGMQLGGVPEEAGTNHRQHGLGKKKEEEKNPCGLPDLKRGCGAEGLDGLGKVQTQLLHLAIERAFVSNHALGSQQAHRDLDHRRSHRPGRFITGMLIPSVGEQEDGQPTNTTHGTLQVTARHKFRW